MLFGFILLIAFVQQEYDVELLIRSPAAIEERPYDKVEPQTFLTEDDIVSEPEKVLSELLAMQQKSWEAIKSVKGRTWKSFYRDRDKSWNVVQLQFAASREPVMNKEFTFYTHKSREQATTEARVDLSGINPNDMDALFCLTAKIRTPEFVVNTDLMRNLRKDITDVIAIETPDKTFRTTFDVWDCQFNFGMSPRDFSRKELERSDLKKIVKKKGDIVELELWTDMIKDAPYQIYLFDTSKSGVAIYSYRMRRSIETEFVNVDGLWLPDHVKESKPDRYAELHFFGWEVNRNMPEEFAIQSIPATKNALIEDRRNGRTRQLFERLKTDKAKKKVQKH